MDVKAGSMIDETRNVDFEITDSANSSRTISGRLIDLTSARRSPNFVMNEDGSFSSTAQIVEQEEIKFTSIVHEYKRNNPSSVVKNELADVADKKCVTDSDYPELWESVSCKKRNKKMTPIPRSVTKNGQTSGAKHFPIDIVFNNQNNGYVENGNERSSNGIGVGERIVKSNTNAAKTDTRKLPGNGIYKAPANHNASAIDIPSTSRKPHRDRSHHTCTMSCSSHKCSQANERSTLVGGTGESTVFEKPQSVCGTRESTVFEKPLEDEIVKILSDQIGKEDIDPPIGETSALKIAWFIY